MKPTKRKVVPTKRNCAFLVLVIVAFALIHALAMPLLGEWSHWFEARDLHELMQERDSRALESREAARRNISAPHELKDIKPSLEDVRELLVGVVDNFLWHHRPGLVNENKMPRESEAPRISETTVPPTSSVGVKNHTVPLSPGRCPVVRPPPTLTWIPRPDKFLMAMCVNGRMGNRLECLMSSMIAAALLNRTMIFPDSEFGYDFSSLVDLEHINNCFRTILAHDPVLVTLSAYQKAQEAGGRPVVVDRLACLPNRRNERALTLWKRNTGIHIVKQECNFTYEVSSIQVAIQDFGADYNYTDEVLAVGEGFGYNMGPPGSQARAGKDPWIVNCKLPVLRPHRRILYAAQDFVKTFLGPQYMSVHLRRTDFMGYCSDPRNKCNYYPIPRVAECLERQAKAANCSVVFLATDASPHEFELLRDLASKSTEWPLAFVRLPANLTLPSGLDWAQALSPDQRRYEEVRASLDRVISAAGSTFIFSEQSTFSREVIRLRTAWQLNGCQDSSLCNGVKAENLPTHYNLETRSKIIAYNPQSRDLTCVAKKTEKSGFRCWRIDKQNRNKNNNTKV